MGKKDIKKELDGIEQLKSNIQNSFSRDKKGWVHFKNGAPKIKLRKHISNIAKTISRYNGHNYESNRLGLTDTYSLHGLKGVNEALINVLIEARDQISKETQDHIDKIQKARELAEESINK